MSPRPAPAPIPRCLHLTTLTNGGGTEGNIARLCAATPAFVHHSLQALAGGYPIALARWPRLVGDLRRLHARHPWRVVFCYGLASHLAAVTAFAPLPRSRRPVLVGGVRGEVDFAGWKRILRAAIAPWFSLWISNARATALGRPRLVIYNGIQPPAPPTAPTTSTGWPTPVLGMLANEDSPTARAAKGHRWMLALWLRLGRPGTMVFAGRLSPQFRRRAEAAGAQCPGYVEAAPLLRTLDLLVVPSASEGLPTVLLEAMALGVPCLATPVGGIGELLQDGHNGYLRPRSQWHALLAAMDWEQARRLGDAGRATVTRDFTFAAMQRRFVAVACRLGRPRDGTIAVSSE